MSYSKLFLILILATPLLLKAGVLEELPPAQGEAFYKWRSSLEKSCNAQFILDEPNPERDIGLDLSLAQKRIPTFPVIKVFEGQSIVLVPQKFRDGPMNSTRTYYFDQKFEVEASWDLDCVVKINGQEVFNDAVAPRSYLGLATQVEFQRTPFLLPHSGEYEKASYLTTNLDRQYTEAMDSDRSLSEAINETLGLTGKHSIDVIGNLGRAYEITLDGEKLGPYFKYDVGFKISPTLAAKIERETLGGKVRASVQTLARNQSGKWASAVAEITYDVKTYLGANTKLQIQSSSEVKIGSGDLQKTIDCITSIDHDNYILPSVIHELCGPFSTIDFSSYALIPQVRQKFADLWATGGTSSSIQEPWTRAYVIWVKKYLEHETSESNQKLESAFDPDNKYPLLRDALRDVQTIILKARPYPNVMTLLDTMLNDRVFRLFWGGVRYPLTNELDASFAQAERLWSYFPYSAMDIASDAARGDYWYLRKFDPVSDEELGAIKETYELLEKLNLFQLTEEVKKISLRDTYRFLILRKSLRLVFNLSQRLKAKRVYVSEGFYTELITQNFNELNLSNVEVAFDIYKYLGGEYYDPKVTLGHLDLRSKRAIFVPVMTDLSPFFKKLPAPFVERIYSDYLKSPVGKECRDDEFFPHIELFKVKVKRYTNRELPESEFEDYLEGFFQGKCVY